MNLSHWSRAPEPENDATNKVRGVGRCRPIRELDTEEWLAQMKHLTLQLLRGLIKNVIEFGGN